jgi:hypothetical protein
MNGSSKLNGKQALKELSKMCILFRSMAQTIAATHSPTTIISDPSCGATLIASNS